MNYFGLLPGETQTVTLFTEIPEAELMEVITLRNLVDAFQAVYYCLMLNILLSSN